jgi:AbrB family looped-hinge helix DNA binding protein
MLADWPHPACAIAANRDRTAAVARDDCIAFCKRWRVTPDSAWPLIGYDAHMPIDHCLVPAKPSVLLRVPAFFCVFPVTPGFAGPAGHLRYCIGCLDGSGAAPRGLHPRIFSWILPPPQGRLESKAKIPYLHTTLRKALEMATLTITAKGQVTLRKDLLQHLGIQPGEQISLEKLPDGRIELRAARRGRPISDAFGMLHREGQRTISIEEMNEAIADAWAGKR